MKNLYTFLLIIQCSIGPSFSQQRYIDAIFDSVLITSDIKYQENISVLDGSPVLDSFYVDIYEPTGDSLTERPLVLFCGTSEFLPPIYNGGPYGTKTDSVNVEIGKRLAQMGYVAAVYEYRLGWNPSPLATDDERRSTIIQAAYRGIQDTRTLIRFFRRNVAESGNEYRVDTSRIAVGGSGTGGYVALGSAYLDKQDELFLPKFINLQTNLPYIVPSIFGNFEGSDTTYVPDSMGSHTSIPLNIGNHVGYSSDFNMVFNIGGVLGDSSWIDAGDMPFVGFHTPNDENAPYMIGNVIVPTTGDIVIPDAAGSYTCAQRSNMFGNNDVFKDMGQRLNDVISQAANEDNDGYEGLFPFIVPDVVGDSLCVTSQPYPLSQKNPNNTPWSWWDEQAFIDALASLPFPNPQAPLPSEYKLYVTS